MRIAKGDRVISSVEDWFAIAPPKKGAQQWVSGRSARELAEAWFPSPGEPSMPSELAALMNSAPDVGLVTLQEAEPECSVRFDDLRGEPRNCDLAVIGKAALGLVAVSIEAKADESFGKTVVKELKAAEGRVSDLAERIRRLSRALFGLPDSHSILGLHYQLIHGTAAALSFAQQRRADCAVFAVHEFVTNLTEDSKHKANAQALDKFVEFLTIGDIRSVPEGRLLGPFKVPGNKHIPGEMPLYVGKAMRNVRKGQH